MKGNCNSVMIVCLNASSVYYSLRHGNNDPIAFPCVAIANTDPHCRESLTRRSKGSKHNQNLQSSSWSMVRRSCLLVHFDLQPKGVGFEPSPGHILVSDQPLIRCRIYLTHSSLMVAITFFKGTTVTEG